MKHVNAMKIDVHRKFLLGTHETRAGLLFEGEVFLLEEHVEDLVAERVVVHWHCHEEHKYDAELGYHQESVRSSVQRRSIQDDRRSQVVGREVTSSGNRQVEDEVDNQRATDNFLDALTIGVDEF